jgi:hypothetical protein
MGENTQGRLLLMSWFAVALRKLLLCFVHCCLSLLAVVLISSCCERSTGVGPHMHACQWIETTTRLWYVMDLPLA